MSVIPRQNTFGLFYGGRGKNIPAFCGLLRPFEKGLAKTLLNPEKGRLISRKIL
jgi:hypothetical protein